MATVRTRETRRPAQPLQIIETVGIGLDLSVRELLANLAGIQETVLLYPTGNKGRPRAQRILTDTDPTQKRLYDIFGLDTYAPRR